MPLQVDMTGQEFAQHRKRLGWSQEKLVEIYGRSREASHQLGARKNTHPKRHNTFDKTFGSSSGKRTYPRNWILNLQEWSRVLKSSKIGYPAFQNR